MKSRPALTALALLVLAGAAWAAGPLLAQPGPGHGHPFSWQDFAERHDVDGDGQVTGEELFQTSDHFDRLDADGDGVVTEADFEAHRATMVFTFLAYRADADDDGDLAAAELDAWFAERDGTGDGRLDAEDFAGERGRPRGHHAGFAEALDADDDGLVTRADLAVIAARLDLDGDGVVAADELPDVPHRRHGRFHPRGPGRGAGPRR